MENKENIFLVKIQNCLKLLDEIEDTIGNNPNDQSNIDYELSDYLHIIQENNQKLDDKTKIELVNKIEKARLQREQYNSIYLIGKYFTENKNKLLYKNSRTIMYKGLSDLLGTLHKPYNYKVFSEEDIKEILKPTKNKPNRKSTISKEMLLECVENGMTSSEIATKYNCSTSNISHLKKQYGLKTRKYNKGDK